MLGATVYNLTFFLELNQRLLTGNFVCTNQRIKAWKPVFHQMLDSIKVLVSETKKEMPHHLDFSQYHFEEGMYAICNGQTYRFFKIGADHYRLISTNQSDLENGFYAKDGVFKKDIGPNEINAAYYRKLVLIYRETEFELESVVKDRVYLSKNNCDAKLIEALQLEMIQQGQYGKWVAKSEIENVIETKLPVEGFPMPENISGNYQHT